MYLSLIMVTMLLLLLLMMMMNCSYRHVNSSAQWRMFSGVGDGAAGVRRDTQYG